MKYLAFAALVAVAACSDAAAPGLDAHASRNAELQGRTLGVLSRNLYVGADVDAVIGALASPDPSDDLAALQGAIGTLMATDFPARARALAREIGETRPHVIGLQEVWVIKVDLTGLGMPVVIDLDFLAILRAELDARGLRYDVAAKVRNTEAAPFPGIAMTDWDVILVDRDRVQLGDFSVARQFAYNIGPVAPGVDIRRGYIALRARVAGKRFTFVNTHLESGSDPQLAQLRAAQAMELAQVIPAGAPVILMGDLNDEPGSPMHQVLLGAGFDDFGSASGLTCCHAADLSNPMAAFTQRIDYVLQRGFDGEKRTTLIGLLPHQRIAGVAGLIWPSDHAGVFAQLRY